MLQFIAALLLEASMIVRVTSRTRREEGDGEGEGGSEGDADDGGEQSFFFSFTSSSMG